MPIEKDTDMLLFRFSNFGKNSFIPAHKEILLRAGYVWMLKIGKRSSVEKLSYIKQCGGWLVLRAPKADGSKSYLAKFDEFSENTPVDKVYPKYYAEILSENDEDNCYNPNPVYQWFKLTSIDKLDESDAENLVVAKTEKKADEVIRTTRTAVMFIRNSKPIVLPGGEPYALF